MARPKSSSNPVELPQPAPTARLEGQIGFQLRLAQLAVFADIIEALKDIQMRPVDMSALMLIDAQPGLRQHVIGDRLKMQRPNVVSLVDALEKRGLVERDVDVKDRRANQLRLTAEGRELMARATAIQDAHSTRLKAALEGIDIANFMAGLKRLASLGPRSDTTKG